MYQKSLTCGSRIFPKLGLLGFVDPANPEKAHWLSSSV
ncbi:hypothetical protein CLV53_1437 [Sediminibacterium magnilacihabitans]|nr:hypothetical protein CLV53_1437 [Sediminibacterium magnilacihabitans]